MTTYASPTKFSDGPEVAGYDDMEVSRPLEKTRPPPSERRTICGLRRTTFFLSLALATVVVLAAAVGGGVGASACSSNKNVIATRPVNVLLMDETGIGTDSVSALRPP
jgi:hypothetical protein